MKENQKKILGKKLRDFRLKKGLTAYKVAQRGGIRISQVKGVEEGTTSYTIDTLLGYIEGCDLCMYFSEKDDMKDLL